MESAMDLSAFESRLAFACESVGYPNLTLKAEQKEAVQHVCNGNDVFVWLPTGYGKSLCYELLPFLLDCPGEGRQSVVLVVSPLVSLMVSQVQSLRRRNLKAAILSHKADKGRDSTLLATEEDLATCRFLFGAPEAIVSSSWTKTLQRSGIGDRIVAVAIDEAHCVSKWSTDFRPAYGRLHEIRALIPQGIPFLACTATVTYSVRQQITRSLEMYESVFVSASPDRPNIFYEVHRRSDVDTDLLPVLTSLKESKCSSPRVLVYCRSLDMCAKLYAHFLYELGEDSYQPRGAEKVSKNRLFDMFHACTPASVKDVILKSLSQPNGKLRVVFATVALGMGIDLKDVNTVIHYGAPHSIEDFFQESGRGGRNGRAARSVVYWSPVDCPRRKELSSVRDREVDSMRRYLENTTICRRYGLLQYFDPTFQSTVDSASCCDVCVNNINEN